MRKRVVALDVTQIQDPAFLKQYSVSELEALAKEIRRFLIEKVSVTGGHIAPNLGVVELTIALHKIFQSPQDKFLWDVGHQAYVHKILTGRAKDFCTLRQYKGLSGFPKMAESVHDVWETGHSSTSLSGAMGMALARDLKKNTQYIVPIIGDGALTGGMALEALNHIGHEKTRMIVILNDNDQSIGPNVGALSSVLSRLRTGSSYNWVKDEIGMFLNKIPAVGGKMARQAVRLKDSFKYLLLDNVFFEEMGFTYLGPIDGHNFEELLKYLEFAKKADEPILLHVLTQKGKGYKPAEQDVVGTWHGTGPYEVESGKFNSKKSDVPSWSQLIANEVEQLAEKDETIVAITPAMTVGSKLSAFKKRFPKRFFDVGIAEEHAVTMAAGLALQGFKPFLSIYSTFLQRSYDQMLHDVCRQNAHVVFGIDRAGLVGADGETHQGVFDISFLRHMPNLILMMPKDENEAHHMIYHAFYTYGGAVCIRYPRGEGLGIPLDDGIKEIVLGSWEIIKDGTDAVLLSFGPTLQMCIEAAKRLEAEQILVRVVNCRFIKPLDETMLHKIFAANIPIVTVEEAMLAGGFGSSILEWGCLHQKNISQVQMLGISDVFVPHGDVPHLLKDLHLTVDAIVKKVKKQMKCKG